MRRAEREGIVSKLLTCSVFCASAAAFSLAAEPRAAGAAGPAAWTESPYRNFHKPEAILGGRVLVSDEAEDPALPQALALELKVLQGELHERDGWRAPFAEGDPLRIFVARKDAGGVRRLASESVERGRLVVASLQIDGTGLSDAQIVRHAARLYAFATLAAYGAPDHSFLTAAAADYLSAGAGPEEDREDALQAAAAPSLDLSARPEALGRLYVEEFARATGGVSTLRAVWEKSAETGQEVLPLFLKAYSDSTGESNGQLLLRFAARFYASAETEAAPSRMGLLDLQIGGLDASFPAAFTLRHRSYLPALDSPAALRVTWPEESAPAAAVVRYRDGALPADVVFLSAGAVRSIPLAGVARVDWLVAGSSAGAASTPLPVSFESLSSFPYSGLVAHAAGNQGGSRVWWTTASHEGLAGWAVFREEVLPDGRVARTGPDILPASDRGGESLEYMFVDPSSSPGTFYRYTVWAVTEDGTLARAFAATLRTAD
jgi:hypothetical protein